MATAKLVKPSPALATWLDLNEALRAADLSKASALLAEEKAGKRRCQFMLRIHCRMNKLRAAEERADLRKLAA